MSAAEWSICTSGIPDGSLKSGVTGGTFQPNGGGSFCFAFNSLDTTVGGRAYALTSAGFGNLVKGVSIRGCVRRGLGAGASGFSPFFFAGLPGVDVLAGNAYMLGLSDDDPHRIVLAKGKPKFGLKSAVAADDADRVILAKGVTTFSPDTWIHLRIDVIQQTNGEVVINCSQNNLTLHGIGTTPDWQPVDGMSQFIDDIAQINSGSAPLNGGYCGYGFATSAVGRRAYFDAIEVYKQV